MLVKPRAAAECLSATCFREGDVRRSNGISFRRSGAGGRARGVISTNSLRCESWRSERTLLRRFRKQVGMAPKEWLLQERVRRAQRLLERSDLPLERISASCGFSSTETFRATFRRIARVAPSVYRRAFRGA
jgi:transcriptional regulator GlxA family with amidase domain